MWVLDNIYIDFPMLVNDTFLVNTVAKISNNSLVNLLADLGSSIADNISALVLELINKL